MLYQVEAFFAEAARRACPAFIRKGAAKAVAYFLHQSEDKVFFATWGCIWGLVIQPHVG